MKTKNLVSIFLGIMVLFGLTCQANAVPYEIEWTGSVWLGSSNTFETWSFDLDADTLDVGDINAGDTINSATLEITFYDDDGDTPQTPSTFGTTFEFADLTIDGVLTSEDVNINTETLSFDVLGTILADHGLILLVEFLDTAPDPFEIPAFSGFSPMLSDFEVQSVKLSGDYSAVPIPGAVWMLGSGLLGLLAVRRRNA